MTHWVLRFLVIIMTVYVLFCLLVYFLQERFIYFPERDQTSSAETLREAMLVYWPGEPQRHRGFMSAAEESQLRGTVVVFHGNAGSAWLRWPYADSLCPLGFRVILAEYPGYGGRSGRTNERAFVEDARETIRMTREKFGGPVYVIGESLGAGVAAAAVSDPKVEVECMVLITPWDSLTRLAGHIYPFLPVKLFLRDRYNSVANLRNFQGRIAVVVTEKDEIIPHKFSLRLFESLNCEKKMIVIHGAGHNNWPHLIDENFWRELMTFIQRKEK